MIERPSSRSFRIARWSWETSSRESEDVGSSITMMRASRASARRISIFCWSAMGSRATMALGSSWKPLASIRSVRRSASVRRSTPQRWSSSPRKTFSATVSAGTS